TFSLPRSRNQVGTSSSRVDGPLPRRRLVAAGGLSVGSEPDRRSRGHRRRAGACSRSCGRGNVAVGVTWAGAWPFDQFDQDFTLRGAGDGWRITAIAQGGVLDENMGPAFVAYPTLVGLQRLRSLRWRPSWEGPTSRRAAADVEPGAVPNTSPQGRPEVG